jgi:hypothetical protein
MSEGSKSATAGDGDYNTIAFPLPLEMIGKLGE